MSGPVLEAREPSARYVAVAESPLARGFKLLATAPAGVAALRELVLAMAMRGQLVKPEAGDGSADSLLSAIATRKKQRVDSGDLRPDRAVTGHVDDEVPFVVPRHWRWVRLGEVSQIVGGGTPKSDDLSMWSTVGIPWLTPADLYGRREKRVGRGRRDISDKGLRESSARVLPLGTVLFSSRAPIGYVAIAANALATNQGFKSCVPHVPDLADYLYWFLKQAARAIDAAASGTTFKEVSGAEFARVVVPLPPLAEQHRIVARVEELMKLCDALEQSGRLAHEQHARLTFTLFDALAASESAHALAENWQRIAAHFDLLLDRPEAIDALETTVLALAFQGKLVPQVPSEDLSVSVVQMIGASQPKPIDETEIPFQIPGSWRWIRLGWAAELINGDRGKNYPNKSEYVPVGLPFINTGHIEPDGTLSRESMHFLTKRKFDSLRGGKTRPGDLVYCLRGATLGKTAVVEYTEGAIASSLVIIRLNEAVARKYAYYFLISPLGRALVRRFDNGSAQPNLAANSVKRYVMPLPPLAEQHRIVARVEELRRLCAQLRERLTEARRTQSQLAEALVRSAQLGE